MIKKVKKCSFVITCFVLSFLKIFSQTITPATGIQKDNKQLTQTLELTQQAPLYAQQIADILFNPVYHGVSGQKVGTENIKDGTPNPYPTTSLNENFVDATFGSNGIKLNTVTIRYIKNFYFYLEYVTKLERAAYLGALALKSNLTDNTGKPADFFSLLSQGGWGLVVNALEKKYGSGSSLLQALQHIQNPSYNGISESINATSWQNVISTDFWKSIVITQKDIMLSSVWQEYLKYMITRSFSHDNSLLASITQAESNIFRYVPDIEVAYYHPDYTQLRYSCELFRINLIITDNLRNRLLKNCTTWKQYLDPTAEQTGVWDAYGATQAYAESPLYTYLSQAEENFGKTIAQAAQNEIKITDSLAREPLAQERLTVLAMIKSLQALIQPIYDFNALDTTIAIMNNKTITKPSPSILLHEADDYYLLQDRAAILQAITQTAQTITRKFSEEKATVTLQALIPFPLHARTDLVKVDTVIVQSFFTDMRNAFKDAGQSIWHAARSLGEGIASVGLKTGAALTGMFSKSTAEKLEDASKTLMQKAAEDFQTSYKNTQNVINDVEQSAEDITAGFGKGLGWIFGKIDPRLGKDAQGAFDAIADQAIENIAGLAHVAVASEAGVIRLSLDAVNVASDIILGGLEAGETGDWSQFAGQLGADAKSLGKDIVSSILDVITLTVKNFVNDLKNLVKFAAYMVSILTDIFIDISRGVTLLSADLANVFGADLNPSQVAGEVDSALESHRRTINAVMVTGLMIGTAVLTGGASIPAMAMIGGQQIFQIVGSYQQDEMQQERLKEEKQFIDNYRLFVDHNKVIASEQQKTWSNELEQKYQAEIANQERNLGFYQNYLAQTFNNYQQQMSEQLGTYLAPQLEPDKHYNTVYADLGGLYGLSTGVYEFHPSQGFSVYNKGRDSFSQEIAVFPAVENTQQGSQVAIENIPSKFWFIQQETYPLTTATNNVEVRLRAIYVLTTYHIGIYFGGKPYDIASIKKSQVAPIDAGHLAKMLVFRKTEASAQPMIGVYQHEAQSLDESKNWIYQSAANPSNFQVGAWYRMKMNMKNSTTLQYKVWQETSNEPEWQEVSVKEQKDPLTTIGVISSGASIEYQILSPQPSIAIVKDAQGNLVREKPSLLEKDREKNARLTMQALSEVTIGTIKLTIADKIALLKSQFIYTTQDTKLTYDNKLINDYVLICQLRDDGSIEDNSIGSSLDGLDNSQKAGIVSVISGYVYDATGSQKGTYPNIFDVWNKKHGPLHTSLRNALLSTEKLYTQQALQPITFGSLILQPTSTQEITNGQFIYTTTWPQLTKNSDPVKDAQKKQLQDYMTFVEESPTKNNILTYNLSYAKTISYALSLVSGDVYDASSPNKIVDSGYNFNDYISSFEKITPLRSELKKSINTAQEAYNAQPTKGSPGTNNTNQAQSNDVSKNQGVQQGSEGTDTKITPTSIAAKSLTTSQQSAGSGQECFGC